MDHQSGGIDVFPIIVTSQLSASNETLLGHRHSGKTVALLRIMEHLYCCCEFYQLISMTCIRMHERTITSRHRSRRRNLSNSLATRQTHVASRVKTHSRKPSPSLRKHVGRRFFLSLCNNALCNSYSLEFRHCHHVLLLPWRFRGRQPLCILPHLLCRRRQNRVASATHDQVFQCERA